MLLKKSELLANKTIQICGSKSISNRLLVLNALFNNIKIDNLSDSKDTEVLQKAINSEAEVIDIHHAGTAMRFLTSYFAIQDGRTVILTGSERMKQRPISNLVEALKKLGADIEYVEKEGFPPLKITGKKIFKSKTSISGNVSSQFISSLLLIGAKLSNGLNLEIEGEITSKPYLKMTVNTIKRSGIDIIFENNFIEIKPKPFLEETYSNIFFFEVESDWSSASYYYSLAAIGRKNINLKSFNNNSIQGDSRLKEIYWENFGVNTVTDIQEYQISLYPENFKFPELIFLNLNDCPDIAQTICVTAAALRIPFEISGLETLKIKETDRLLALQNELRKIGCETKISDDTIKSIDFFKISEEIKIKTYDDHRMAMSFAPFCLISDLKIENENVVEKSYPKFWEDFCSLLQP